MRHRRLFTTAVMAGLLIAAHFVLRKVQRPYAWVPPAEAQSGIIAVDHIGAVWSKPVPDFLNASFSPDGGYFAIVNGAGDIHLFHRSGREIWSRTSPGTDRVALGYMARWVVSYAAIDPTHPQIVLIRGIDGSTAAKPVLDGAVWDVDMSADGQYAGLVTGSRTLWMYSLGDLPTAHTWKLEGIGNSLAISGDSAHVAAGTWDDSGVTCFSAAGLPQWQFPANVDQRHALEDRIFETHVSQDGQFVLGLSYSNIRQGDGALYLWRTEGNGVPVWTYDLGRDAFSPKVAMTANGRYVAVSYVHAINHEDEKASERHLLVLGRDGKVVLDEGGLLFAPELITMTPDGRRLTVSDGARTLYQLNANGQIVASYTLPANLRASIPSADGRYLLVYTGDGMLTMLDLDSS